MKYTWGATHTHAHTHTHTHRGRERHSHTHTPTHTGVHVYRRGRRIVSEGVRNIEQPPCPTHSATHRRVCVQSWWRQIVGGSWQHHPPPLRDTHTHTHTHTHKNPNKHT